MMQYFIEIEENEKGHIAGCQFCATMELGDLQGYGNSVEEALQKLKARVELEISRLQEQTYTRVIRINPEIEIEHE
ncbi:hypothetical protein [Larkinella arboricola]